MQDDDAIVATKAGVLRCKAEKYWVENTQRRVRKAAMSAVASKRRFLMPTFHTSILTLDGVVLLSFCSSSFRWSRTS